MSMKLHCRMERKAEYTRLVLPVSEAPRAYMLLDSLMTGRLSSFDLTGEGGPMRCCIAEQDAFSEDVWMITRRSAEYIKSVLFQAAAQPSAVQWLHADIETASGDVTICFEP